MQVLCEHQGRSEEARRYAEVARRCWAKADPDQLTAELASLRSERYGTRRAASTRSDSTTRH
jgi:hypothetical protein